MTTEHETDLPHIRILGRPGSALAYMIRDFLHRGDVPFDWIELHSDDEARAKANVADLHDSRLPVCLFADGSRLECPTIRQITEQAGDVRHGSVKRCASAVGEGAMAVTLVHRYLAGG